jgi:hypothetical protein
LWVQTDKSTVVGEIIKYIQSLQVKLEEMTKKQQQVLAARTLSAFHSLDTQRTKAFVSNGLTLVDHSGDPSSTTAITALPPPGRESCLQSYLGSNVGLHVCGLNVFITTSSPRGRQGLLHQLLVTIHQHDLDVINANISTSNASIFHCLHCQVSNTIPKSATQCPQPCLIDHLMMMMMMIAEKKIQLTDVVV